MPRRKHDIANLLKRSGVKCPECHCRDLRTWWTEPMGNRIKRHKYCRHCGHGPIITIEEAAADKRQ